ncbi:MAG: transposase [Candidatus Sulfotelmatobacter sp.]
MRPPLHVPVWENSHISHHFSDSYSVLDDKIAPALTFYRRNLPHLQRDYKPHFITFVTKSRQVLPDWARDITLSCCLHDHGTRYSLHVAVVMPNHVHLILTPLTDQERLLIVSLIEIMRAIKGASARAINQRLRLHGAIWQEESFDHVLRSSENLDTGIDYILQNPVRAGIVPDWQMYPWVWRRPAANRHVPPGSFPA